MNRLAFTAGFGLFVTACYARPADRDAAASDDSGSQSGSTSGSNDEDMDGDGTAPTSDGDADTTDGASSGDSSGGELGCDDRPPLTIGGAADGDFSGFAVDIAGDVNGDGIDDLVVGAPYALGRGRAYVLFGGEDVASGASDVDAAVAGARGFSITGETTDDVFGHTVRGVGDIDGDGLDDVAVGARFAGDGDGRVYIVFGRDSGAPVLAADIVAGDGGFALLGERFSEAGFSIASGDVTGDGERDLLVGAPQQGAGRLYVVSDPGGGATIDLTDVAAGLGGYAIDGVDPSEQLGFAVATLGDISGDGIDEIATSAPFSFLSMGRVYVVFGGPNPPADITGGEDGFAIVGGGGDQIGTALADAGDTDGDGRSDLLIGIPERSIAVALVGPWQAGPVTTIDDALAQGKAVRHYTADAFSRAGSALAAAGDVDDDGRADYLVGARSASGANELAGRIYLVASPPQEGSVFLDGLSPPGGLVLEGPAPMAGYGHAAAAGDFDGDGCMDVVGGAPTAGGGYIALTFAVAR